MSKELVERYIKFYNTFAIDEMVELFINNCLFESVSNSQGSFITHGKEELRSLARKSTTIFSTRKQTVTNWVIGSDSIAVEIDYTATCASDLPNGLKKGDYLNLKGISIFEFAENKIKRLVDFS